MCSKTNIALCNKKAIERTPASEENRKRVEFMDSHEFSLKVDKSTGSLQCKVQKK